jgi:transcriptional regulator with XRE-family HTH domain
MATTIGENLRRLRKERGLTQEALAERAGVSVSTVARLERGRRRGERTSTLMTLANALDAELSDLTGRRERLGTDRDGGSVLAIRDVILSPSLLPGWEEDGDEEPTPLPHLRADVDRAWSRYWAGNFGPVVAALPDLIRQARLTSETTDRQGGDLLAQAYQLAAALLVHFGKTDLAAVSAERALRVAADGDDVLQWLTLHSTYAWILLNQARLSEAEAVAANVAARNEPSFSAPAEHIAVWGKLQISALWPAIAAGRDVSDYVTAAAAGAERIGRPIEAYQATFGPSWVATHAVHAYVVRKDPGVALKAAAKVDRSQLRNITLGSHLLDLAQAHADARQFRAAEARLEEARRVSAVWFRHEVAARELVADIREQQTRITPGIRQLARTVGLES